MGARANALVLMVMLLSAASPAHAQETSAPAEEIVGSAAPAPPPARSAYEGLPIARPAATTRPVSAQAPRVASAPRLDYRQVVLALAIVLSIIWVLVWVYRRFFGGPALQRMNGAMKVLGRMPVTPKQHVLLLQVGRRVVVVADNGAQMTPLSQIEDPDEVAALVGQLGAERVVSGSAFGSWFGKAKGNYEPPVESAEPSNVLAPQQDEQVDEARGEISGLMDKVRLLSQQFRRTS